jgi:hypothetical protein
MHSAILDAARAAYAQGLCLLPVREDGTKAPDVSRWVAYQTNRPTPQEMRGFNFADRCGIGVVGGEVSGCIDPWDFDCVAIYQDFVHAAEACGLGDVVRQIVAGYEDETPGSSGRRWLVRYPAGLSFQDVALARRPGQRDEPRVRR